MIATPDLFHGTKPPRAKPRVLMHVSDAGQVDCGAREDLGKPNCQMTCTKCGLENGYLIFDTVTEAKRGIPCWACNEGVTQP